MTASYALLALVSARLSR